MRAGFLGLLLAYSVEKLTSDGNMINSDKLKLSNILFLLNHVPAGSAPGQAWRRRISE